MTGVAQIPQESERGCGRVREDGCRTGVAERPEDSERGRGNRAATDPRALTMSPAQTMQQNI